MGIKYNGVDVTSVVFNGAAVDNLVYNGQSAFTSVDVDVSQSAPSGGDSSTLSGAADGDLFLTNTLTAGDETTILENQYSDEILATSYSLSTIYYSGGNATVELQSITDDPDATWETVASFNVTSDPQDFSGVINTAAKSFRIVVVSSDADGQLAIDSFNVGITEYDPDNPEDQTEAPSGGDTTASETQDNVYFNTVVSSGAAFDVLKKSYPEKVSLTGYNITGLFFSGTSGSSTCSLQASDDDANWVDIATFDTSGIVRQTFTDSGLAIEAKYFRLRMTQFQYDGYASLDSFLLTVQPLAGDIIEDVSSVVTEPSLSQGLGRAISINAAETRIAIGGGPVGGEKIVIHELNDGVIGSQIGGVIAHNVFHTINSNYGFGKFDQIAISDDGQTVAIAMVDRYLYVYKLSGSNEWSLFASHNNTYGDITGLYMAPDASFIAYADPYYGGSGVGRVHYLTASDNYSTPTYFNRGTVSGNPAYDYYGYGGIKGLEHNGNKYVFIPAHGNGHGSDEAAIDGDRRGLVDLYESTDGGVTFSKKTQFIGLDSPDTTAEQIGYNVAANFASNGNLVVRVIGTRVSDQSLNEHIFETNLSDGFGVHVNSFNRQSTAKAHLNAKFKGNITAGYYDSYYHRMRFNPDATTIEDYYTVEQTITGLEGSGEGEVHEAFAILSDGTMFYGHGWGSRTTGGIKKYIPESAQDSGVVDGPTSENYVLSHSVSDSLDMNQARFSFNTTGIPLSDNDSLDSSQRTLTFSEEQGSFFGIGKVWMNGSPKNWYNTKHEGTPNIYGGVFQFDGKTPANAGSTERGGLLWTSEGFSPEWNAGRAYSIWVRIADSDINGVPHNGTISQFIFSDCVYINGPDSSQNSGCYLMAYPTDTVKSNIDPEQTILAYNSVIDQPSASGFTDSDGNSYTGYTNQSFIRRKHFPNGTFEYNKWYHLVMTNDSETRTQKVFINGEFVLSSTHGSTEPFKWRSTLSNPFDIGRRNYYSYGGFQYQGWIGQLDVYENSELTSPISDADAATIYNAEVPYYNYVEQNFFFESVDTDGDGVVDTQDAFPNDSTESVDTDGDGVGDNSDVAPNDPNLSVDADGDGVDDSVDPDFVDSDGDGVVDAQDAFPNDPTRTNAPQAGETGYTETFSGELGSSYGGTKELEMVYCEPGTFTMGQESDPAAVPVHNVTLTKGFYLGKYEVTQAQYQAVMTGNTDGLSATPSNFAGNPDRPVEKVSWNHAQVFLARLNEQQAANLPTGWAYALPTEAEWEYACRAGTTTDYSWGDTISASDANYDSSIGQTTDVGSYPANPWGFFDMHGNVMEYCADAYGDYSSDDQTDPFNAGVDGDNRIVRGGHYSSPSNWLKSAKRGFTSPTKYWDSGMGFRVALKQIDTDGDGDGVVDSEDAFPNDPLETVDTDGDGVGDNADAFPEDPAKYFDTSYTTTLSLSETDKDLEMIWVEPGTFTMGQAGLTYSEPEHQVTLTKGFFLGKYEVTQAQYEAVMTGNTDGLSATPSNWHGYPNRPVEKVSWLDIQKFLARLNAQEAGNIPNGWAYVLPTEAQWEYACRAGTTTAYSWGDSITTSDANYYDSGYSQTRDVGLYPANPWGFHDMHGNVREWCSDWYSSYSAGSVTDPEGPATSGTTLRVNRGGAWNKAGADLRSAYRTSNNDVTRASTVGFRVALKQVS